MHLYLNGLAVEITSQSQIILHLTEDTAVSSRMLANALTTTPEQHRCLMDDLQKARRGGLQLWDERGNSLGRWRVTDLPVSYRMDEADQTHKLLFELEKLPDLGFDITSDI